MSERTIASEIIRLQGAKADIKAAIEAKGVTVDSSLTLSGYAEKIGDIVDRPALQSKTVTPEAASSVAVTADANYYGLDTVTVRKIPYEEKDNLLGGKTVKIAMATT